MFARLVISFVTIIIIKSAQILIMVPMPSISHQVVFRPLIQELLNRNHEVTVITTDPAYPQGGAPTNLTEINVHEASYLLWNDMLNKMERDSRNDMLYIMKTMYRVSREVFEQQLKDQSVQKIIADKTVKFDLLILEACIVSPLVLTHIFKAPAILMSSLGANYGYMEMIGAMTHSLLHPTHYKDRIYNLTIWEKINELYNHVMFDRMFEKQLLQDDKMLQSIIGNDTPSLSELKNNLDMLFINTHPIWIHNQPVPHSLFYAWGIHKTPEGILPKDLQSYLDSSKHGVIYISFGTNFKSSTFTSKKLDILIKVFSKLPNDILWKWDMDELPGKSDNIKIAKWFPQTDILRHPNLKLFITQGGLQSTDEAISAGVPVIGIPNFADQIYNTEKYVHFKIGIQLNFKSLTTEKFENAIRTILTDDSYRKNIINLRSKMHDQPKPALENAICWIDYVLRHGGARHLRSPAANMSWTEYYELEIVFVVLGGLTVLIAMLVSILYSSFKCISLVVNTKFTKSKIL